MMNEFMDESTMDVVIGLNKVIHVVLLPCVHVFASMVQYLYTPSFRRALLHLPQHNKGGQYSYQCIDFPFLNQ